MTARIPSGTAPGTYDVSGHCGGGNLGITAQLTVTAAAPPTAVPAGSGGQAAPPAPSRPVRLSMPTPGARATVVPVASTGRALDVPGDPAQVGWWTASALPGSAAGALFRLTRLRAGDPIAITTAAGTRLTYKVTGSRVYAKSQGLPASLFAAAGVPPLVLITCGGPFDRSVLNYQDNIAVFASPLPDSTIGSIHHP